MRPTYRSRNDEQLRGHLRKLRRYSLVAGLVCAIAFVPFWVRYGFGRSAVGGVFLIGAVCGLLGALPIPVRDPGSQKYIEALEMSRWMFLTALLFLFTAVVFGALRALGLL